MSYANRAKSIEEQLDVYGTELSARIREAAARGYQPEQLNQDLMGQGDYGRVNGYSREEEQARRAALEERQRDLANQQRDIQTALDGWQANREEDRKWAGMSPSQITAHFEAERIKELRQQHLENEQKRHVQTVVAWTSDHPEFPTSPQAQKLMEDFIRQHFDGVVSYDAMSTAYTALVETGKLVPNYSKAHRAAQEETLEILRANGMNVERYSEADLRKMPMDQLRKLMDGVNND